MIEACSQFLEKQLDPSNAIGIANFAEQHGCNELYKKANQFIERHFTQVTIHMLILAQCFAGQWFIGVVGLVFRSARKKNFSSWVPYNWYLSSNGTSWTFRRRRKCTRLYWNGSSMTRIIDIPRWSIYCARYDVSISRRTSSRNRWRTVMYWKRHQRVEST